MGFTYALIHLYWTIPPAIFLTFIYHPLCTTIDIYKILFLITVAVISTIPWDSYLIQHEIWTYPPNVIIGPTLFSIPLEEVFFFVIQTYSTSLIFLLFNKWTLKPCFLVENGPTLLQRQRFQRLRMLGVAGTVFIAQLFVLGVILVYKGGKWTYLGLILEWTGPFAILLWTLGYQFLIELPYSSTLCSIAIPTMYLWILDTVALRRGTWTIESGTKLGVCLWEGLDIEEAVFFFMTNTLIVFGLVAFENATAVLEAFEKQFPDIPTIPSPYLLFRALLVDPENYNGVRINGIKDAVDRLSKKSRSFYLASSLFPGRLRIDLILLYSFCRVADDLVDNACHKCIDGDQVHVGTWITRLNSFLDEKYNPKNSSRLPDIINLFPKTNLSALRCLPTKLLPQQPLYDLLEGFKTDLKFSSENRTEKFPIQTEEDLHIYAGQVAGTVAELCIELAFHHCPSAIGISFVSRKRIISAGKRMGIALQFVNIARDIIVDAAIDRVYIPTSWLEIEGLTPEDFKNQCLLYGKINPQINYHSGLVDRMRQFVLTEAFKLYDEARSVMNELPGEARAPMIAAVESYMEIGRVLMEQMSKNKYQGYAGQRATVPKLRRFRVAWQALRS